MSLYLKYRPHDFNNLEGQDFIKDTLKQAIKEDKTVGAYLFCGPRGTGKTSTARILAKTINCEKIDNGNPCLICSICKDFLENKLIDIIEIDAASYTGVDNIRDIIEKSQFIPTRTKYKVYIIDEVHMLTKGAFNALLKILEEPPFHVKFILATTEVDKVPETILSRCQRYDFKRGTNKNIKNRLLYIAKGEKVKIDEKSLDYIIKSSGGGFRNAISLFEQLIINKEIQFDNIVKILGLTNIDLIEGFLTKLLDKDKTIITDFENIISDGKNIKLFFKDLIFFIKDSIIKDLEKNLNITSKIYILDKLNDTYTKSKNSLDEDTIFLIGLLKIVSSYTEPIIFNPISTNIEFSKKKSMTNIPKIISKGLVNNLEGQVKIDKSKGENNALEGKDDKQKIKEDIVSDATAIFEIEDEKLTNGIKENSNFISKGKLDFDKEKFIKEVKKCGGKAGVTMSLRGGDFIIKENSLNIIFKTKFALNSINNNENISFLQEALVYLGKEKLKLNLSSL